MLENIRLSLKGILSHKMRSFLTMLGIIIGIAAIISIVSTIKGTNKQIEQNLIGDGSNTVTIQLYENGWAQDYSYMDVPNGVPSFGENVKETLLAIKGVERVSMYHVRESVYDMYYLNKSMNSISVFGADSDFLVTKGMRVVEGRGISSNDIDEGRMVCVVDSTVVAATFNGESPVGKTIDLSGCPFTVVGVVEKTSKFEPVIETESDYATYVTNENGMICIPDSTWPVAFQYDEPVTVLLKTKTTQDMTTAGKTCENILNSFLTVSDGSGIAYQANNLADQASQLQQLSSSTNIMLIGIASISLLVGGIGVMNIMLVSVTERTREIGLKKALGARKRAIRSQFLTEAAMLSIIGGLLGIIVGLIMSKIISVVAEVPVAISIPSILVSVLFSMVIGIVFGMVPSMKASNLNPIDALRYE